MVEPLPKWAMRRYAVLWQAFAEREFSHADAVRTFGIAEGTTSVTLNALKRAGWLSAELDKGDSRKRVYRLVAPESAILGMGGRA